MTVFVLGWRLLFDVQDVSWDSVLFTDGLDWNPQRLYLEVGSFEIGDILSCESIYGKRQVKNIRAALQDQSKGLFPFQ